MRLDLKESIVFPFSDPSWIVKTLVATACQLLVLPMPAVLGYQLAIIRQTANGEDQKLPEFDGFGTLWMRGLIVSLILMVLFALPTTVVVGLAVGGAIALGDQASGAFVMGVAAIVLLLCAICFLLAFLMPAMILRYAMTEQVSCFFDFSTAIADIKQGFVDYLAIFLFPLVASFALAMLGFMTAGLGLLLSYPVSVLIMFIQARMIGNYYRLYFM